MAENIADRVAFLTKDFHTVLEIGSGKGHIIPKLQQAYQEFAQFAPQAVPSVPLGIQTYYMNDASEPLLRSKESHDAQCRILHFC
jgi:hypothetical protein